MLEWGVESREAVVCELCGDCHKRQKIECEDVNKRKEVKSR